MKFEMDFIDKMVDKLPAGSRKAILVIIGVAAIFGMPVPDMEPERLMYLIIAKYASITLMVICGVLAQLKLDRQNGNP